LRSCWAWPPLEEPPPPLEVPVLEVPALAALVAAEPLDALAV
jgi:hypothetical protein